MRFQEPLNQIFDSEVKVRILRFLCRRGGEWSGRRLAAELGINPTTAHSALRELREMAAVEFRSVGRTFAYSMADDHYLVREILRPAFQREAQAVGYVARALQRTLGASVRSAVVTAAIFGSVARRQERSTSDLDLLVLVRSPQAKRQVERKLNRHWEFFTRSFGHPLAPYVNTVAEARRKHRRGVALFREILRTHEMLWGKPLEDVLRGRAA